MHVCMPGLCQFLSSSGYFLFIADKQWDFQASITGACIAEVTIKQGTLKLERQGTLELAMSESTLHSTSDMQDVENTSADYLVFYSSIDPNSNKMWCPDCRDVESLVEQVFRQPGAPSALIVYVGQRSGWKDSANPFRATPWKINSVPTIVRRNDGARLVENAITDEALNEFISGA